MQTEVCVRQGFRFPAPRQGEFLPLDPDQPCAVWMPGTRRRSITTKGADPRPLTPAQPCAGWMRGRVFAPCTTTGEHCPLRPLEGACPMSAITTASWYHCSVKPVSRSAGRSVVAAAAYRLGECLHDERYQTVHDYTRRRGVECTFTVAPVDAPEWAHNAGALWNAAERAETRKNSTLAREVELALPSLLEPAERERIAERFAEALVERYNVAVSVAIHNPGRHGDDRNYHAHILFTTREMTPAGLGKKTRVLDDRKTGPKEVTKLRELAADIINEHLAAANADIRVDHRSFKERGIDREPTTHLGPAAAEMERRGEQTDRGDMNRQALRSTARRSKSKRCLPSERLSTKPSKTNASASVRPLLTQRTHWSVCAKPPSRSVRP